MNGTLDEEADTMVPSIDVQPIQDRSNILAAFREDQRLIPLLDAEVDKRSLRLSAARTVLVERQTTLEQAMTRQDTAKQLYTLSKHVMDQIECEGQLKTTQRGPRDESSRHGRSLSSMDQSRQALVDRTATTLRDATSELQAASSDLAIAQRNVVTAEAFVTYASRSLASAEQQRAIAKGFLDDEASALRPTPELPEGLWRRIFAMVVAEESDLPRLSGDVLLEWGSRPLALPLSYVSKEWRRIAISTPYLWTGIQIVYTKGRRFRPEFLRGMLRLAGSSPITIAITINHDSMFTIVSATRLIRTAFTENHRVKHIKCQVREVFAPHIEAFLSAFPSAETLTFKGPSMPMQPASRPFRLSPDRVASATTINISNISLRRLPPLLFGSAPPWSLRTLFTDIPSLLHIDIGSSAPILERIVISQPPPQTEDLRQQQRAPWYDEGDGFDVENVTATHLVIHSMPLDHMAPLIRYVRRLRLVAKLELYGISAQFLLVALKENSEGSQRTWLPSLNELVVHDYESHGPALGLYVAARLDLAQRSLVEGEIMIQPLRKVVLDRCSNMSDETVALIQEHCVAGQRLIARLSDDNGGMPQST